MELFLNQLVNGLCQGAIYALMAVGYSIIAGITGLVSFAYGDIMTLGAFASFYAFQYAGNHIILGLIASFAATWILGALIYKICYERFLNAPRYITLICTFAFGTALRNLMQILFGEAKKPMLNIVKNKIFYLGPIMVSSLQIVILIIVFAMSIGLSLYMNKSRVGLKLRAVSQDRTAASVVGINVSRYTMIGSCIGSGFGGIAGVLLAIYYQTVYPMLGNIMSMKSFAASVLGGLTDTTMSSLGGICIGITENIGISLTSASLRDIFTFAFLMLVLIIKPQGFAKKKGVRP